DLQPPAAAPSGVERQVESREAHVQKLARHDVLQALHFGRLDVAGVLRCRDARQIYETGDVLKVSRVESIGEICSIGTLERGQRRVEARGGRKGHHLGEGTLKEVLVQAQPSCDKMESGRNEVSASCSPDHVPSGEALWLKASLHCCSASWKRF